VVEDTARRGEEPDQRGDARDALPGVVREAPELDPVERVAVEPAVRHPGTPEADRSLGERVRREAEPAAVADSPRDRAGVEAAVLDVLVEPEREQVVATERRHLLARQQQDVAVPALLAELPGGDRVVVGEEDDVGARPRGGAGDLAHGPGPVGVRRVDVDHAGKVVHGGWVVSMT
jgi:hypothetical protein